MFISALAPGTHSVLVYIGNDRLRTRTELKYCMVHEAALASPQYLCQCLDVPDLQALDLKLKGIFMASLPEGRWMDLIFRNLPETDYSGKVLISPIYSFCWCLPRTGQSLTVLTGDFQELASCLQF